MVTTMRNWLAAALLLLAAGEVNAQTNGVSTLPNAQALALYNGISQPTCTLTAASTVASDAVTCPTNSKNSPQVNAVTLTGATTLGLPGHLPAGGGENLLYMITHSGVADGPTLAAGFEYPGATQPPECGTGSPTITQNCWSTGTQTDWLSCSSIDASHVGCSPVLTNMGVISTPLFAFVNANSCVSASGPTCTVSSVSMTGADLLIVCATWQTFTGDITGVPTDSSSNTYTQALLVNNTNQSTKTACYYKQAPTVTGTMTFTASFTANTFPYIAAIGFSGSVATPLDQTNSFNSGATQNLTSAQPGSITPIQNNELVLAFLGINANAASSGNSIDSGYTLKNSQNFVAGTNLGGAMGYLIQTTAAATNPTFSWSGQNSVQAMIMSFK